MNTSIYKLLSQSLGFAEKQIEKTIELLDSGATIPFISRYRKEATGSLDEVQIGNIKEAYDKLCETEKRKKFIISTIEEQGKLSEELKQRIDSCWDITELEDIYLPYKPRRRTRAEIAREHGLEPLAKIIMAQKSEKIKTSAARFVTPEIPDEQTAVEGACDIIAEWVSENERARNTIRRCFEHSAVVHAKVIKGKETEGDKYRDYFEWSEPLRRCASHKILAVRRGPGTAELVFTGDDGQVIKETIHKFDGPGVLQGQHNVDKSIESFARSCFKYALDTKQTLWFATKDTISKKYDHTFKDIFQEIFDAEYKEQFDAAGIEYFYTLIDDAVARVMKSEGGYIWACKNYDGDVMSDMISSAFGSLAMMTSVLVSPDGKYEYEAAHGTVMRHYYKHLAGEETSTNSVATIFAWSGALRKRGELDGIQALQDFADKLEAATIKTIEDGKMTKDLALITTLENPTVLNSENFIKAIRETLEGML